MPPPEAHPDDLELLAEQAVAAVLDEPPPAGTDPAITRRLVVVVEAIRAGREPDPSTSGGAGR